MYGHDDIFMSWLLFDGSDWSTPKSTSLEYASNPTVTSLGKNEMYLFAVDDDGDLVYGYYNGQWSGSDTLSEDDIPHFEGNPTAISSGGSDDQIGRIDLFFRGDDGQYYHIHTIPEGDDFAWSDWSCHGGNFSSAPEIISPQDNATQRLDVFGVTSDDELVHQMWDGEVWYPGLDQWETLGSVLKAF